MNLDFLLDFAQQLLDKIADVPEIFFGLLHVACISPTPVLNQNGKFKVNWILSRNVCHKLQMLCTQSPAAHGSVFKSVESSNQLVPQNKQILPLNFCHAKFSLFSLKFGRMISFAGLEANI